MTISEGPTGEAGEESYRAFYGEDGVMGDEREGLIEKYAVCRNSTGEPVLDCFVLRYDRDPHALVALAAYAESVRPENPKLSDDLRQLVKDWAA